VDFRPGPPHAWGGGSLVFGPLWSPDAGAAAPDGGGGFESAVRAAVRAGRWRGLRCYTLAVARLVPVAALCSGGVLGLVVQCGFGKGWWSASFGAHGGGSWAVDVGCSCCAPSGEILAPAWPELAMVTPAGVTYFLGSIVVRCAHSCTCGLDSGGKPQIRDRAMEALLCLFLVGGIVSESPAVRVWGKMVVVGCCVRSKCAVWQS
jgi:hypothetical protein